MAVPELINRLQLERPTDTVRILTPIYQYPTDAPINHELENVESDRSRGLVLLIGYEPGEILQ